MKNEPENKENDEVGKPPVFSTWNRLYALVLLNLVILVALFYWFTKAFE